MQKSATNLQYPILLTEKEILTNLNKGEDLAFQRFYTRYRKHVLHYALRFVPCSELAQDIIQDVFLKIWENRNQLAKVKCMEAYLFTMCKNKCLTVRTRLAHEQQALQNLAYQYPDPDAESVGELVTEQRSKWLGIAIRQLPPQRRRIFQRCKIEGKSYREVALELNVSPGTINDHIVKATRAIRKFLYLCGSFQET